MRAELVEVMAKAMYRFARDRVDWDDETPGVKLIYLARAAVVLDAALTWLEANAKETVKYSLALEDLDFENLLAVLREEE